MLKYCKFCNTKKELPEFYRTNPYKCKECANTALRKWRHSRGEKYIKQRSAYMKQYRKENRDYISEYYKNWYKKNGRPDRHHDNA